MQPSPKRSKREGANAVCTPELSDEALKSAKKANGNDKFFAVNQLLFGFHYDGNHNTIKETGAEDAEPDEGVQRADNPQRNHLPETDPKYAPKGYFETVHQVDQWYSNLLLENSDRKKQIAEAIARRQLQVHSFFLNVGLL